MLKLLQVIAAVLCIALLAPSITQGQPGATTPRFVGSHLGQPLIVRNGRLWMLKRKGGWSVFSGPYAPDAPANEVMWYAYPFLILISGEGRVHINGSWYSCGLADSSATLHFRSPSLSRNLG